jgi:MFS family permease
MDTASSQKSIPSSLFRHKPFTCFWFARVATAIAFQMVGVAVGWQIYALTDSAWYLGLVGLAQFLPMFCLTLFAGFVADRYDRRTISRACQILEAIATVVLAWGSASAWLTKNTILFIVFLIGSARAFEGPTMIALLPQLVSKEVLPRAVTVSASAMQTAMIVGPAIGGILYVAGPVTVYLVASLLFFAASVFLSLFKSVATKSQRERISLAAISAGILFIWKRKEILGAISLDLFAVLLGGATALLPIYARDILQTGPWGLGFLRATPAIGALTMSIWLAHHPLRTHIGRTMFSAVAVFGLVTIVFALSTSFALSLAALFVMGAADVISVVIRQSLVQLQTPDEMRGRVSAVNSLFIGTSNQLGEFESGVTAALFGVVPAVVIGGVGTLLVVLLWMRLFPQLKRIHSFSS